MRRYKQFHPIIISDFSVSEWPHPPHNHNHYELIYIKAGKGTHLLNNNALPYQKGDLFLLGPDDWHIFEIKLKTHFSYLKFTDNFFLPEQSLLKEDIRQRLEVFFKNPEIRQQHIHLSEKNKQIVKAIFELLPLMKEDESNYASLLEFQLLSLLEVLKPSLPIYAESKQFSNMELILNYIHEHIYYPDKLRLSNLASLIHTTPTYIGKYFYRNVGCSIREYTFKYKHELIKRRIQSGNYRMKEIANEFNFVDESHLQKFLKR